jgi:hypothetical protein
MNEPLTSEQCDGRYPVPQTAPPREEAEHPTYRCGLPKGHKGPHGPIGGLVAETIVPRAPWREGAIWLRSEGYSLVVSVERGGKWVDVIRDAGGHPSHIVEVLGINGCLGKSGL